MNLFNTITDFIFVFSIHYEENYEAKKKEHTMFTTIWNCQSRKYEITFESILAKLCWKLRMKINKSYVTKQQHDASVIEFYNKNLR